MKAITKKTAGLCAVFAKIKEFRELKKDLPARGVYVEYQNGANQKGTTNNKSVEKLVRVSSQMLNIWAALEFRKKPPAANL